MIINMTKSLFIAAMLVATSISTAAFAGETKPAVTDKDGKPVRSTNGNCVRFVFEEGQDVCAPAPEPTPAPAPVAAPAPAPTPEPVALLSREELTVYFDFNKDNINPSEMQKLEAVVAALVASKGVESLSIVGYADRIGSSDANLKLSERRTKAVEAYLDSKVTIPTNVVQANSRGEEGSVTSCDDKAKRAELVSCLANDRRAEIVLNYMK